jgi:hypothetical protein
VIVLVRDNSPTPKVWELAGCSRRHVKDAAECVALDAINNAYLPGVTQPVYPDYPVVDWVVLFRRPIINNIA